MVVLTGTKGEITSFDSDTQCRRAAQIRDGVPLICG